MKDFFSILFFLASAPVLMAQTAPSWTDYVAKRELGQAATLPDYSFAGYRFSEESIPNVSSWTKFDVTDYGAVADDGQYDDAGIQSAVDAAVASNEPAVVFFPPGKFMVSNDNNITHYIKITGSNIVLKGSGSEQGGTEIFMHEKRVANGHWQFSFEPAATSVGVKAVIDGAVKRGDRVVYVQSSENLTEGQVVHIYHKSEEFARAYFDDLELSEDWTRLFGSGGGMAVYEPHIIESISGNRVTFKNPIQTDLPVLTFGYNIREHVTIEEVGVEDILFTSDWENYGEDFVHHKDDIHDYGWNALQFENVKNGWIRNCEFRSWSQSVSVTQCIGVTVENVKLTGKMGHASFSTRRGFGLLVKDCEDQAGQHHGPGTGYQGVNTVYLRYVMQKDQSVDSHSGQPYATLIDDVQGGDFDQNGGPHESYPHHGRLFTFWNFRHNSSADKTYNFWQLSRNGNTYADPIFVGFQSTTNVIFLNEALDEMRGQMVEPRSLFEAQLDLRLEETATLPVVKITSPVNAQREDAGTDITVSANASDPDGQISAVRFYVNGSLINEKNSTPYTWSPENFAEINSMPAGSYKIKLEATDDVDNTAVDSVSFVIGTLPTLDIIRPETDAIVDLSEGLIVEAQASDSDGSITSANLYLDNQLVRTISEGSFIWGESQSVDPALFDMSGGAHTLRLEVVDNDGLIVSESRSIVSNSFPEVNFTKPTDGQSFEFSSNVQLEVDATDVDGSISQVDLFINGKFYRQELNAPFDWGVRSDIDPTLFDMEAGTYQFEAIAYDNLGSTSSTTITVTVEAEVLPLAYVESKVSVYPNPFTDSFAIASFPDFNAANAHLYGLDGKLLDQHISIRNADGQMVVSVDEDLNCGIYLFSFLNQKNHREVIRLIKN